MNSIENELIQIDFQSQFAVEFGVGALNTSELLSYVTYANLSITKINQNKTMVYYYYVNVFLLLLLLKP